MTEHIACDLNYSREKCYETHGYHDVTVSTGSAAKCSPLREVGTDAEDAHPLGCPSPCAPSSGGPPQPLPLSSSCPFVVRFIFRTLGSQRECEHFSGSSVLPCSLPFSNSLLKTVACTRLFTTFLLISHPLGLGSLSSPWGAGCSHGSPTFPMLLKPAAARASWVFPLF